MNVQFFNIIVMHGLHCVVILTFCTNISLNVGLLAFFNNLVQDSITYVTKSILFYLFDLI